MTMNVKEEVGGGRKWKEEDGEGNRKTGVEERE